MISEADTGTRRWRAHMSKRLAVLFVVSALTFSAMAVATPSAGFAAPSVSAFHCRNNDTAWHDIPGLPKYKGYKVQYRYTGYWQDIDRHYHFYKIRLKKGLFGLWVTQPEPLMKNCGSGASSAHPRSTKSP